MSDRSSEPELLESLLSNHQPPPDPADPSSPFADEPEDLDALVDELENTFAQARHAPFTRKLMVEEGRALELVDRLRAAVPVAVRQAQRVLDEQDRILDEARDQARRMLHERGLMAELEVERERIMAAAERDADRMRLDADAYVRGVLNDLAERLTKFQASVQNGLDALQSPQTPPKG